MNAVNFPEMLKNNKTTIVNDKAATLQNLKNLLLSAKQTLLGDPFIGSNLTKLLYEKNNVIIKDLVIDDIYNCIQQYIPQLFVERKNITVSSDRSTVFVEIRAQNIIDYNFENYTLKLLTGEGV